MKVLFSDGSELGFGHGFDTPAAQVAWVLADGLIVALRGWAVSSCWQMPRPKEPSDG